MREPEVSVVIPAFNAADTLGEQLAALAEQRTDFAWEVLVCDNGSTDDTAAIADAWGDRLPGLRVIDASARRGPSAARNIGAATARAPRLAFCDADDVVGAGWVTAMRAALDDDALVAGSLEGDLLNPDSTTLPWSHDAVLIHWVLPWLYAASSNNLGIRTDVFRRIGGFEEAMRASEDVDLVWRVQLAGHRLAYRPEAVIHVRKRSGLRAIVRQYYGYGAGDMHLQHRYQRVATAYRSDPGIPIAPSVYDAANDANADLHELSFARRVVHKLRTVRGRALFAERARRLGTWLGQRSARLDAALPVIEPPEELPRAS